MAVKFMTIKGASTIATKPFYIGIPQHERVIGKKEAYEIAAERTGYKATAVRAVFMALKEFVRENQNRGNITYIDEVASIRNAVRGSFAALTGPWVKGKNVLMINAVEMEPFKTILEGVVPTNNTEGAKPVIYTVLDETTREYDVITGTDVFSIAGADLGPDAAKDDEFVSLVSTNGALYPFHIDEDVSKQLKIGHLEVTPPQGCDGKMVVVSRAGDPNGPEQRVFRKVKFLAE